MSGAHWPRVRARAHELENLRAGARPKCFKVSTSATNFDERTKALVFDCHRWAIKIREKVPSTHILYISPGYLQKFALHVYKVVKISVITNVQLTTLQ